MTVGLGFSWLVREHVRTAETLKIKTEAMLKARSAYDMLMYALLTGKLTNKTLRLSPEGESLLGVAHLPLNREEMALSNDIVFSIQESNGLLSLMGFQGEVWERLLQTVSPSLGSNHMLARYLDWVDSDNLVRVNGAERVDYELESLPYTPRNYPLQYKAELQFIKGMTPDLYQELSPFLTLLPASGFNPNTASIPVLEAYLDIDHRTAVALQERVKHLPVIRDSELYALSGRKIVKDTEVYFYPSPWMEITIRVGKPKALYTIWAGIDLRETLIAPFSVLQWKEL